MTKYLQIPALLCCLFAAPHSGASQSTILFTKIQDTIAQYHASKLPPLISLAGEKRKPYYKYLWVFGDGSFVNNTRDSIIQHWYDNAPNDKRLHASGKIPVAVYATDTYTGGVRPPKIIVPNDPTKYVSAPPALEKTVNVTSQITLATTSPAPAYRLENGAAFIQLNHAIRPQDTTVAVISIKNPYPFPIYQGKIFLFYNGKVEREVIPELISDEVTNGSTPPPPPQFGNFKFQKSLVHYNDTGNAALFAGALPTAAVNDNFKNMLLFDYGTLNPGEQKNVFVEMANDSTMWDFITGQEKAKISFLTVHVLTYLPSDVGFPADSLTPVSDDFLKKSGIQDLFNDFLFNVFTSNNSVVAAPVSQGQGYVNAIIGYHQTTSEFVKSHDPNSLSVYTCKCPTGERQKLYGIIKFSNEGAAAVNQTTVSMLIPPQLDANSIKLVNHVPNTDSFEVKITQAVNNGTVSWVLPAVIHSPLEEGFGDPSTEGYIAFSIEAVEGADLSAMDSLSACVTFFGSETECTVPVKVNGNVEPGSENEKIQHLLKCQQCENNNGGGFPDWCLWILLVILLLILLLAAFWKKLFGSRRT
jgi:hypothetical protein